jgi:hypothetical protein
VYCGCVSRKLATSAPEPRSTSRRRPSTHPNVGTSSTSRSAAGATASAINASPPARLTPWLTDRSVGTSNARATWVART